MLQYALKFESVLFTFTIIYITFLFSLGPLPLSPNLLFLPTISSFLHRIVSTLSLISFLCSLSLLHVIASLSNETQAGASSHTTPHEPDLHSQIAVHQHNHTNSTHHIHSNPWPNRHAAELAVPSTTSSKPPTIGFLLISLQWGVLLLGLFDLGCGFFWFGCVFFISLVVFDVGFVVPISLVVCVWSFFFFFLIEVALVGLCRWWLSVLLRQ